MRKIDPYRLFFPFGFVFSVIGVGLWIPWSLHISSNYPGAHHPDIMIGGFLLSYALGFLTTAIPKFTGTVGMTSVERFFSLLAVAFLSISFVASNSTSIHFFTFLILIFLILFGGRRFSLRSSEPPPSFFLVGVGLFFGLAGSLGLLLCDLGIVSEIWRSHFRSAFYIYFMLSLILGVGSRLIPALLGHQNVPTPKEASSSYQKRSLKVFIKTIPLGLRLSAVLFALSFFLQLSPLTAFWAQVFRVGSISYIAVSYWHLLSLPKSPGIMPVMIWLSSWSLVASQWALLLLPSRRFEAEHLLFIGGFGLLTLMISTRVTLSHGGGDLSLEKTSKLLFLCGVLALLASGLRFASSYFSSLVGWFFLAASVIWILAFVVWLLGFGRFWLQTHSQS